MLSTVTVDSFFSGHALASLWGRFVFVRDVPHVFVRHVTHGSGRRLGFGRAEFGERVGVED
jgi:hypothetical protein